MKKMTTEKITSKTLNYRPPFRIKISACATWNHDMLGSASTLEKQWTCMKVIFTGLFTVNQGCGNHNIMKDEASKKMCGNHMVRYNEALSNSLTPCGGKCASLERRKATIKAPSPAKHGESGVGKQRLKGVASKDFLKNCFNSLGVKGRRLR